jgi:hypothetical protein
MQSVLGLKDSGGPEGLTKERRIGWNLEGEHLQSGSSILLTACPTHIALYFSWGFRRTRSIIRSRRWLGGTTATAGLRRNGIAITVLRTRGTETLVHPRGVRRDQRDTTGGVDVPEDSENA